MGYSIGSKGVGAVREESILPPRRSVEAFEVLDAQWCILLYLERYNVNEKRSPVGLNKIIGTMPLCPRSLRLCLSSVQDLSSYVKHYCVARAARCPHVAEGLICSYYLHFEVLN